jgi:hypothetical protein
MEVLIYEREEAKPYIEGFTPPHIESWEMY